MLTLIDNRDGDILVVSLKGRLDTNTSPELEDHIKGLITPESSLILDCATLDYISSAGLRVLLSTQKILYASGSMKLIHVNDVVSEILDVTGFCDILTIE